MAKITVKKAKILKGVKMEIHCTRTEGGRTWDSPKETHPTPVHDDLKAAYGALSIHLAIMTGYVPSKKVKDIKNPDPELYKDFEVTSYSIGGDEDDQGVTLTGMHTLANGKKHTLNTPFTRFEEGEETAYPNIDDLKEKLDACEYEVLEYMEGRKVGIDPQGKLDFENTAETAEEPEADPALN